MSCADAVAVAHAATVKTPLARSYYVLRLAEGTGHYLKRRAPGSDRLVITEKRQEAVSFPSVSVALDALSAHAAAHDLIYHRGVGIVRVDEYEEKPAETSYELTPTLEPAGPDDRFVVITRHQPRDVLAAPLEPAEVVATQKLVLDGHGHYLKWFSKWNDVRRETTSYPSLEAAARAVGSAQWAVGISFVGIRRLVAKRSEPVVRRVETVLA